MTAKTQRLNKALAQSGLGSRRYCDQLIQAQRVHVNGQIAQVGQQVGENDHITLDGKPITPKAPPVVLAFYKPPGVTTTKKDPYAKVTLDNFLPDEYKALFPVGRLDRASRGLLLLTNDGDLAYELTHPKFEHEKEYEVQITSSRNLTEVEFKRDLKRLTEEIINPLVQTKPIKIVSSDFSFMHGHPLGKVTLILEEGKKRQIRQLFSQLGYNVTDLLRTRIDSIRLENLKPGQYRRIKS